MVQCESQPFRHKHDQPVSASNEAQASFEKFRLKINRICSAKIFTHSPADSELVIKPSPLHVYSLVKV